MVKGTLIGIFNASGGKGLAELASKISAEKSLIIWFGVEGSEYVARSLMPENLPQNLIPIRDISTEEGAVGDALSTLASSIRHNIGSGYILKYKGGTNLPIYEVFKLEKRD